MNVVIKNPNGTINPRQTALLAIRAIAGMGLDGETNLVSDVAFDARITEDMKLESTFGDDGQAEFMRGMIRSEYRKIIREAIKIGAAFHIGKQCYDVTVWSVNNEIIRIADILDWMRGKSNTDQLAYDSLVDDANTLRLWVAKYAKIVGLDAGK